jgi:hypothetical protein
VLECFSYVICQCQLYLRLLPLQKQFYLSFSTAHWLKMYHDFSVCNGVLHFDRFSPMPQTSHSLILVASNVNTVQNLLKQDGKQGFFCRMRFSC